MQSKLVIGLLVLALAVENAWLFYPRVRAAVMRLEEDEIARGRRLAHELGCFNCHGPGGKGGVPNPGSENETIPSFHEGTPMMFVASDQDIREYILDGAPAAKRARASYREKIATQAVQMPAYRGFVSDAELKALVAYVRAVSDLLAPREELVQKGAEIARANGCFSCHGEMGSGGLPNPGSLKGYIPGFLGNDFRELVQSDEELFDWIAKGEIVRISQHPIGQRYFEGQRIRMPAYNRFLTEEEIRAVAAYVRWLAEGSWRDQPLMDQ